MADKKINIDMEIKSQFAADILKPLSTKPMSEAPGRFGEDVASAFKKDTTLSRAGEILQVAKLITPELMFLSLMSIPIVLTQIIGFAGAILSGVAEKLGLSDLIKFIGKSASNIVKLFTKTDEESKQDESGTSSLGAGDTLFGSTDLTGEDETDTSGSIAGEDTSFGTTPVAENDRTMEQIQELQDFMDRLEEMYNSGMSIDDIKKEIFANDILTQEERESLINGVGNGSQFITDIDNMKSQLEQDEIELKMKPSMDDTALNGKVTTIMDKLNKEAEKGYNDLAETTNKGVTKENGFISTLRGLYSDFMDDLGKVASLLEFIRNPAKLEAPDLESARREVDSTCQLIDNALNHQSNLQPYQVNPYPYYTNPGLLLQNGNSSQSNTIGGNPVRTNTLYGGD